MQEIVRRSQKERSEVMRATQDRAGRALFVAQGIGGTGTPEVVAPAWVTRGAIQHHFADREAQFEAVVRAEAVAVALQPSDLAGRAPVEAIAGGRGVLRAMRQPGRIRLLLIEAPAVLGLARLADIVSETGGRTLLVGLAAAGVADATLVQLLIASYDRAALALDGGEAAEPWLVALGRIVRGAVG